MRRRTAIVCALGAASVPYAWGCRVTNSAPNGPFEQSEPGFYQEVSWSPDGASLLVSVLEFTDAAPGYAYRIWKLDPAGADPAPLTEGPRDYWTSWSPDGARIAFAAPADTGALDVFTINADGTDRRRLTSDEADDTQPAWSPDGRRIAFISHRSGIGQLWIMNADGTGARRLLESPGEAQNPAWSPDGTRIAFYETGGQGNDDVFVVQADGSDPRPLAEGVWPAWTPDGGSVLFGGEGGLYRVAVAGGAPELMIAGNVLAGELSPQGTRLAYIVQDSAAVSVVVAGADGRNPRQLMTRPAPQW